MKSTIPVITLGKKYLALQAEPVDVLTGLKTYVHRSLNNREWTVTEGTTGCSFATRKTKREVIATTKRIVATVGRDGILAEIAQHPVAPPVHTLVAHKCPAVQKSKSIQAIADAIDKLITLSPDEHRGVVTALSTKTGRLKSRAPSDPWGKAAWSGLQPNAYKISVGAMMMLPDGGPRDLLNKLLKHQWPAILDKDMSELTASGVW